MVLAGVAAGKITNTIQSIWEIVNNLSIFMILAAGKIANTIHVQSIWEFVIRWHWYVIEAAITTINAFNIKLRKII
jgi:hypothetical protein